MNPLRFSQPLPYKMYKELSDRINQNVKTPAGAYVLALDIELKRGKKISVNTVKRFLGIIQSLFPPKQETLDIIADYLGFKDYDELTKSKKYFCSRFSPRGDTLVDMTRVFAGSKVEISWTKTSKLYLFHRGNGEYEVLEANDCLLQANDVLILNQLAEGYRFIAERVFREGTELGMYMSAEDSEITHIDIIDVDKKYFYRYVNENDSHLFKRTLPNIHQYPEE